MAKINSSEHIRRSMGFVFHTQDCQVCKRVPIDAYHKDWSLCPEGEKLSRSLNRYCRHAKILEKWDYIKRKLKDSN